MKSPDHWLYEYSIIRYVPRIDREEFLNIGLIMMCKRQKWLKGMVFLNEDRIRALFPDADINNLKKQTALFEKTDVPFKDIPVEEKYRWLAATKSAMLQSSPSHPGIVSIIPEDLTDREILEREFERLFFNLVI